MKKEYTFGNIFKGDQGLPYMLVNLGDGLISLVNLTSGYVLTPLQTDIVTEKQFFTFSEKDKIIIPDEVIDKLLHSETSHYGGHQRFTKIADNLFSNGFTINEITKIETSS